MGHLPTLATLGKLGSHMPVTYLQRSCWYCLGYFLDKREHALPATRAITKFYRWHACEDKLESASQACQRVKTGMTNFAGYFCSHIGTVSQAVPAAMSQVHQRHMRTGLAKKVGRESNR